MSAPDAKPTRFRLPNTLSIQSLLIASLCAIVGSVEVLLWAVLRARPFLLQAGVALIVIGLAFLVAALINRARASWIAYLYPDRLAVVRGSRRTELRWSEFNSLSTTKQTLVLHGTDGRTRERLFVNRRALKSDTLTRLVDALQEHSN